MGDFVIRGYRPGDEFPILEMFNEVFHQDRKIEHWYWKYRDHPLGSHALSLAEAPDGTLAAHYGGYPVRVALHLPDQSPTELETYHLGDKMTRARFRDVGIRKRGLLARTFFHFKETFGKSIPYGYGFGTHHSLRIGLLLFDYMDVEPVGFWRKAVHASDPWWGTTIQWPRMYRVEEATSVDESWSALFARVAPAYHCLNVRDEAHLRWRYLSRPDRRYLLLALRYGRKLVGWSVFCRTGNVLEWVDALADPVHGSSVRLLIDAAVKHPLAAGVEEMACWFAPRPHWWKRILEDMGFVSQPEPNGLHLCGPLFANQRSREMLARWYYYSKGDGDLC